MKQTDLKKIRSMLARDGILFSRDLLPSLLLSVLLATICCIAGTAGALGSGRQAAPAAVALVDEEDSFRSRVALNTVFHQEYISSIMTIQEESTREEALEKMESGCYGAVIVLPEGFLEDFMHGIPCSGYLFVSDSLENEQEIIRAVADFGERLITAGQAGIFSGEQVIRDSGLPSEVHTRFLETANGKLLSFAFGAYSSLFTVEYVSYGSTGVSLPEYFGACWLVFLLFLTGLFFPDLYITDCRGSVSARLRSCGIRASHFLPGKVLYPFLFRAVLLFVFLLLLRLFGIYRTDLSAMSVLLLLAACLYVSLLTGLTSVALSVKGGWSVLILASSAVFLFLAGGMVPGAMLPQSFLKASLYTPFGPALQLVLSAIGGTADRAPDNYPLISTAVLLLYSAAALFSAVRFYRGEHTQEEEVRL